MDFKKLKTILPKAPELWDINDVAKWLEFIGCEKYIGNFSKAFIIETVSFDGMLWEELTDDLLKTEI